MSAPLSEVAYGTRFVAPDFGVVLFGQYYDLIRKDFGEYQTVPPVPSQRPGDVLELPQLPRVWFVSGSRLIQLQADRYIYNWRRLPGDSTPYPRFATLFEEFKKEYSRFRDFAAHALSLPIELEELNLTYVNQIKPADTLESPIFIFRENEWRRELPDPEVWLTQFRFAFPDENVRLSVMARPSFDTVSRQVVTTFEIGVTSIAKPKDHAVEDWFVRAHDRLHWGFSKLVRNEWLELWGYDNQDV